MYVKYQNKYMMKAAMRNLVFCTILLFTTISCNTSEKESILNVTVASETVLRKVVPSQEETEHMVITGLSTQTLYLPFGGIENFEYEKGYEYKLLVQKSYIKNPPMDSGNERYTLVEILSKEKK